ncbi:DUF3667 domain-containing protein [uncultured Chitinophaga sp.]|uniref:DUF3667 domain-containing protein n=1 Tax=uncultured Chitinophaga sp. TaxID=339340 RepID=UPI0026070639|nr:DUF3667 domain-containing protein [uncultured Chitinophaga sp.]
MKTQPLRQDKHCLNCGTEVPERYCTHCGQENAVPHESFGHLVKHFVGDVLHYDSQFLTTLKYLLFRPGRLTKEYMAGKRVSYVNPIKLYIFISFMFFLVFAMVTHKEHSSAGEADEEREERTEQTEDTIPSAASLIRMVKDSIAAASKPEEAHLDADTATGNDTVYRYRPLRAEPATGIAVAKKDTLHKDTTRKKKIVLSKEDTDYRSLADYDSAQAALPPDQRDQGFSRWITRRALAMGGSSKQDAFEEALKHNAPKMMFVLLPLFALWLKILYRKRYYADHAIFALHVHCFAFVVLLITLLLDKLLHTDRVTAWGLLLIGIYLWLALKNTYQQSYRRSFMKAILLLSGYSFSFLFVFVFFVVWLFAVIL